MSDHKETLYEVIDAISQLDIEELLKKVDAIIAQLTDADSTGIYTLDHKTDAVILRASKQHFDVVGNLKMPIGTGITGWVAQQGKSVVIERGAPQDERFELVPSLPDDMYESFLSVPILNGKVVVGVINVKHEQPRKYPPQTVQLLEMIGKLVGRAVEHAILLEQTSDMQEALATQKAVSTAKGILMKEKQFSENDAYHYIRNKAMEKRKSMKEVAQVVIDSTEVLG